MQVASPSYPPARCIGEKLINDSNKLEIQEEGEEIRKSERSWSILEETVEFDEDEAREEEEDEEDEYEGEEFSFVCLNAEISQITADEAFEDGQIRPVFPLFNRDLLFDDDNDDGVSVADENSEDILPPVRKFFVEDSDGDGEAGAADSETEPMGPYCSWSGETVAEASPETCRKSNSTGFSKLWRFRDLVLRSNSDGRDAFVYLNSNVGDKTQPLKRTSKDEKKKTTEKKTTEKRTESAHERLYMRNRALKEEGKHRSYLPYKQVGFFTDVNGLSRNIHPF